MSPRSPRRSRRYFNLSIVFLIGFASLVTVGALASGGRVGIKGSGEAQDKRAAGENLDNSFKGGGAGKNQSGAVKVEPTPPQSLPTVQSGILQDAGDGPFQPYTPPPKTERTRPIALPGSDLVEFSAPRKLSPAQQQMLGPVVPVSTFTIVIVPGPSLAGNAPALAAFNAAAASWAAHFTDPILVTIEADLAPLNPGTIGSTSAVSLQANYNTIRNAVVADANSSAEAGDNIATSLPTAAQFVGTLPAGFAFNGNVFASKANLKALGFTGLDDPPAMGGFGPSDGTITFSTNFSFDYDRSDGISPGTIDFQTVATHEIGHLLGFFSAVDTVDAVLPATSNSIQPTPLDLFRFKSDNLPTNAATFTSLARNFVPGNIGVTSDTVTSPLMSTGVDFGDGRQASHWKDDTYTGVLIGVMDPTLDFAKIEDVDKTDVHAFDLIGYDLAPNTAPVASVTPNPVVTNQDTAILITLTGTDVDDDDLTFSVTTAPAHGALGTISVPNCSPVNTCTATVTYTPNLNYNGADAFKFKVNDGTVDSAEATVNITVCGGPPAITPTPAQVCQGSTGNTDSGPTGQTSYSWSITNGTITGGSGTQTVTYTAGAAGNVGLTLNVVTPSGCAQSNSINVPITSLPAQPTITPGGSTITCDSLVLTSSSVSGNQWYLNGNPIGGATSQTYSATASGDYTVVVTASGCSSAASAATNVTVQQSVLTVTNTNDSGAGSLRDRIANVCVGGTVNFDPLLNGQAITLTSGELLIDKNLTIAGPGADLLTVRRSTASGTPDFRIFEITPGKTVAILGLTINNGKTNGDGAGINNQGALSLSNCAVTANQSTASGGGVANDAAGTLVVTASTISGNTGTQSGGGIANGGTLTLINSTISGNTGDGLSNNNLANLTNDTFSNNSVRGVTSNGGATTNVRNTIVANTPGSAGDVGGAFNSQGNNLIGKSDGSTGFDGVNNDKIGTAAAPLNAFLAVLGNYGGPMQTHALLPGSPAINAANNCVTDVAHCGDANIPQLSSDQRGLGRQVNGTVDIGSFESRGFTIAVTSGTPQSAPINTAFGSSLVATVSSPTSEPVIGGQVTFTAPGAGAGATFTGGVANINSPVNASGQASASANANGNAGGPYTVSAAGNGINGTANFSLTNSKGSQTINFGSIGSQTFGDPDFGVSATATSGLPVSLGATGNCTATSPSPGTVHITGAGSCAITA